MNTIISRYISSNKKRILFEIVLLGIITASIFSVYGSVMYVLGGENTAVGPDVSYKAPVPTQTEVMEELERQQVVVDEKEVVQIQKEIISQDVDYKTKVEILNNLNKR